MAGNGKVAGGIELVKKVFNGQRWVPCLMEAGEVGVKGVGGDGAVGRPEMRE